MARGWESKSVESQQDEAARGRTLGPAMTDEQRARAERRRTIELTLSRAKDDLSHAHAPLHRRMLEQAIAALEQQLTEL